MWIRPGRFEFSSTPLFLSFLRCRPIFALLSWKAQGYMVYSFLSYANRELRFDHGPNAHPASFWLALHSATSYRNLVAHSVSLNIANCHSDGLSRCVSRLFRFKRTLQWTLLEISQISLHDVHWLLGIFTCWQSTRPYTFFVFEINKKRYALVSCARKKVSL